MSVDVPTEANGRDDATVLVARGVEAIEEGAKQTRHKFLWTWLAIALLATVSGFGVVIGLANRDSRIHAAEEKAQDVKQQSDDIVGYLKGDNGLPGVPGEDGTPGSPGLPGQRGPSGPQGVKGDKGAKGDKGDPGTPGTAGSPGASGAPGSPGVNGEAGSAGAQGEKGSTGSTGSAGTAGQSGTQGPPGPQGPQGVQGPAGPAGGACPAGTTPTQVAANDVNGRPVVVAACAVP